ncbi:hypothetical protein BVX98_07755, partial [bacterium F11]
EDPWRIKYSPTFKFLKYLYNGAFGVYFLKGRRSNKLVLYQPSGRRFPNGQGERILSKQNIIGLADDPDTKTFVTLNDKGELERIKLSDVAAMEKPRFYRNLAFAMVVMFAATYLGYLPLVFLAIMIFFEEIAHILSVVLGRMLKGESLVSAFLSLKFEWDLNPFGGGTFFGVQTDSAMVKAVGQLTFMTMGVIFGASAGLSMGWILPLVGVTIWSEEGIHWTRSAFRTFVPFRFESQQPAGGIFEQPTEVLDEQSVPNVVPTVLPYEDAEVEVFDQNGILSQLMNRSEEGVELGRRGGVAAQTQFTSAPSQMNVVHAGAPLQAIREAYDVSDQLQEKVYMPVLMTRAELDAKIRRTPNDPNALVLQAALDSGRLVFMTLDELDNLPIDVAVAALTGNISADILVLFMEKYQELTGIQVLDIIILSNQELNIIGKQALLDNNIQIQILIAVEVESLGIEGKLERRMVVFIQA